jgi:hypothetical protein
MSMNLARSSKRGKKVQKILCPTAPCTVVPAPAEPTPNGDTCQGLWLAKEISGRACDGGIGDASMSALALFGTK